MKTLFTLFTFTLCIVLQAGATRQERDLLIIQGKRIYTHDLPNLKEAFPSLDVPEFMMMSTANYDGYRASWAVFGNQLYLVGLAARLRSTGKDLWDDQVLIGHKLPLKVEDWDGKIILSSPGYRMGADGTKTETFDSVTTIIFKSGKLTTSKFDEKVPHSQSSPKN